MSLVGVAVSLLGLFVAFGQLHLRPLSIEPRVPWSQLWRALGGARWQWLGAYAVLNAFTLLLRAQQLQALARTRDDRPPSLSASWRAVTLGMLAQTLLPARLGEAVRAMAIARDGQVAAPVAVGAIILGRVLDLVALLTVCCLPPLLFDFHGAEAMSEQLRPAARVGSLFAATLFVALAVLHHHRHAVARSAERLRPWLGRLIGGLAEGLSAFRSPTRLLTAAVTTLLVPVTVAACYAVAAVGFHFSLSGVGALVMVAAVFMAIAVPSAPSAVGVYHAVAGWVLVKLGASAAAAAAFVITTHAVGVIEFVVLGGIAVAQLGAPVERAL